MTLLSPRFVRLVCCGVAAVLLGGCHWLHRNRVSSCRETTVVTEARNLPPLKVPPGLDAPDTRTAIKVPELSEPERPRDPHEPCLSQPPSYKG